MQNGFGIDVKCNRKCYGLAFKLVFTSSFFPVLVCSLSHLAAIPSQFTCIFPTYHVCYLPCTSRVFYRIWKWRNNDNMRGNLQWNFCNCSKFYSHRRGKKAKRTHKKWGRTSWQEYNRIQDKANEIVEPFSWISFIIMSQTARFAYFLVVVVALFALLLKLLFECVQFEQKCEKKTILRAAQCICCTFHYLQRFHKVPLSIWYISLCAISERRNIHDSG